MNWIRGLFRLWAVLSLIWIAGNAIILPKAFSIKDYPRASTETEIAALPANIEYVYVDGTIQRTLGRGMRYTEGHHPPGTSGYVTPKFAKYPESWSYVLFFYALVMFVPPVLIVLAAMLGLWILAGFSIGPRRL